MLLCDLISELADGRFDSIGRGQRLLVLQAFNRRTMRSWAERQKELSMGAAENDRKHDDLCVGSMATRPMDQQRTS